ncbi:MAG: glycosyltransferase family 2 protein [Clostridium perfringens]|nr:glycosyltransferase family 2 protein [Clostridium perfringens]
MQNLILSIVIPVYNVEKYIKRCIESIIDKYNEHIEIILVDDGSTDNSGKICDEIAAMSKNISVIHKANGGLADARNSGIKVSGGNYIQFLDPDDWVESNIYDTIFPILKLYKPDLIKFGYNRVINGKVVYKEFPKVEEGYHEKEDFRKKVFSVALGNGKLFDYNSSFIMSACMTIYNLEIIKKYELYFKSEREILNEDILFNLEFLNQCDNSYILHNYFYYYDCRDGSLTQRYKPNMYERKIKLLDYYEKNVNGKDVLNIYKVNYAQFIVEHIYDCAVMEVQWNLNKKECIKRLKIIFDDKRLENAISLLQTKNLSLKAKTIVFIMKRKKVFAFKILYSIIKKIQSIRMDD